MSLSMLNVLRTPQSRGVLPYVAAMTRRMYHANVIDHYERPRNVGSMEKNDPNVGTGLVGAPACGDVMKLQIRVDDNGKIIESKFKTFGCGSAIASSSLATEMVKGMNISDAVKIKNADIAGELKLPPVKLHCSMLAEDAIKAAVKNLEEKRKQNGFERSVNEISKDAVERKGKTVEWSIV